MATRRSRLQVKPNIGGPKGPSTKPAPSRKTSFKDETAEDIKKETNDNALSTSKDQNVKDKKLSTEVPKKTKNTEENKLLEESTKSQRKDKGLDDTDVNDVNESIKNDGVTSPPTRARIRRFGKVNLSAVRGGASETVTQKSDSLNVSGAGDTVSNVKKIKNESEAILKNNTDDATAKEDTCKIEENKTIPRRSRFPKAKPNLLDAGKRRQRTSESTSNQDDSTQESPSNTAKPNTSVPSIIVTPSEDMPKSESAPRALLDIPGTVTADTTEEVKMTQIQPRPPMPRSPMKTPVSPAVLSSPVKQIHGADKRQRTVSVTEAPVPKRAKRPHVSAPTDQPPDRTRMRMRDLIHWNPKSNPMMPKVKKVTEKVVVDVEKENVAKDNVGTKSELEISEDSNSSMPVPQVTIGPDGNIVINEQSLVVRNPDQEKGSAEEDGIIDETDLITTYRSFRKVNTSKRWSNKETAKFYKALGMIGIDFTLINKLFPSRSRFEIKKKFKKEERKNKPLVDKVLKEGIHFDPTVFDNPVEESSEEEEVIKKKETKKKGRKKKETDTPKPKKTPTKRLKKPLNYYDESLSEEEDENPVNPSARDDTAWQPSSVSQKDGEVVDILMDMSKGRLTTDGNQIENSMVVDNTPKQYGEHKNQSSPVKQPVIPGLQSIITFQTQQMVPNSARNLNNGQNASFQSPSSTVNSPSLDRGNHSPNIVTGSPPYSASLISDYNSSGRSNRVVLSSPNSAIQTSSTDLNRAIVPQYAPFRNVSSRTDSSIQTDLVQNQTVYQSAQQGTNTVNYADDSVSHTVMPASIQMAGNQDQDEQYVLVTVVPEGGEETVIHIYKLHSSQNVEGTDDQTPNVVSDVSPSVENL